MHQRVIKAYREQDRGLAASRIGGLAANCWSSRAAGMAHPGDPRNPGSGFRDKC
jgi:hypothetical protein